MFQRWKHKLKRTKEIQALRDYIDKEFKDAADVAKTPQEKGEAEQFAYSHCQWEINQLEYLEQEDILIALKTAPFEVPEEYWADGGYEFKKILRKKYVAWASHELKKLRYAEIEFWTKLIGTLVLPVIAIIVSIFALLHKSK